MEGAWDNHTPSEVVAFLKVVYLPASFPGKRPTELKWVTAIPRNYPADNTYMSQVQELGDGDLAPFLFVFIDTIIVNNTRRVRHFGIRCHMAVTSTRCLLIVVACSTLHNLLHTEKVTLANIDTNLLSNFFESVSFQTWSKARSASAT